MWQGRIALGCGAARVLLNVADQGSGVLHFDALPLVLDCCVFVTQLGWTDDNGFNGVPSAAFVCDLPAGCQPIIIHALPWATKRGSRIRASGDGWGMCVRG